ncbi:MAG: hypothetical protein M3094_02685 [Actinomycetia bacterium]|nr:hypothetical protein [Actinomycetes bacterium]
MALAPGEMQKLFVLTQTMIRFAKQIELMRHELEEIQTDVFNIVSKLMKESD